MAKSDEKKAGVDDIRRGNVGTGDQGPGDVRPTGKVGPRTGKVKGGSQGKGSGR